MLLCGIVLHGVEVERLRVVVRRDEAAHINTRAAHSAVVYPYTTTTASAHPVEVEAPRTDGRRRGLRWQARDASPFAGRAVRLQAVARVTRTVVVARLLVVPIGAAAAAHAEVIVVVEIVAAGIAAAVQSVPTAITAIVVRQHVRETGALR